MRAFLSFGIIALLTSCSVQSQIEVSSVGSADLSIVVEKTQALTAAWNNLQALDSTLPDDPLSNDSLSRSLGPSATIQTRGDTKTIRFHVDDARKIFRNWDPQAALWNLTVDRATLRRLLGVDRPGASPIWTTLLPAGDATISEQDYKDLLIYLLGPEITPEAAKGLVETSTITIVLKTPRTIRSAEGAQSVTANQATYVWPLLKALSLEKPLQIRILF